MLWWYPDRRHESCVECRDLARQLNEAYAGECETSSPAPSSPNPEQVQAASEALHRLIGGTEEDAERADELLAPFRNQLPPGLPQLSPRIVAILRLCVGHVARTGHFLKRTVR
ncbi:MAG TPA: hypothetical protein VMH00_07655 [Candidatus Limnocylindrales bacterium]|nr:hypothetical protein [Candidatus Limnocylindrales bacterium]